MFATTEPHKIPSTILSRCQRFDFKRVPGPVLVAHLNNLCQKEQLQVEAAGLGLIARAAEGSVRDALSLLDQVMAYASLDGSITTARVAEILGVTDRRVLFELSQSLLDQNAEKMLSIVDHVFMSGQDISQFAQSFLTHLRDLTVVNTCADPAPLVDATAADLEELQKQSKHARAELLPQLFHQFSHFTEEISRSTHPRILLEMGFIEMLHAEPLLPLGDLLDRLEALELRIIGKGPIANRPSPNSPNPTRSSATAERSFSRQAPSSGTITAPSPSSSRGPHKDSPTEKPQNIGKDQLPPAKLAFPQPGENVMERWQQLLHAVEAKRPVAVSAFIPGKLISWDQVTITLGYPSGSFELQRALDREKIKLFEEECARQLGKAIQLKVKELSAEEAANAPSNTLSAMEDRAQKQAKRSQLLRDEARSHPMTRAFQEKLGATIDDIVTEADEK